MARPIPREPPVTTATWPASSMTCPHAASRRVLSSTTLTCAIDTPHERREYFSRSNLDDGFHSHVQQGLHRLLPADRCGHLIDQESRHPHLRPEGFGFHIGDHGHLHISEGDLGQFRLQTLGRGRHQRAMKGCAHRQFHDFHGALFQASGHGPCARPQRARR